MRRFFPPSLTAAEAFAARSLQGLRHLRGPRRFDTVIVRAHRYPRPPSSPPDKAKTFVEIYESKYIWGGTSPTHEAAKTLLVSAFLDGRWPMAWPMADGMFAFSGGE